MAALGAAWGTIIRTHRGAYPYPRVDAGGLSVFLSKTAVQLTALHLKSLAPMLDGFTAHLGLTALCCSLRNNAQAKKLRIFCAPRLHCTTPPQLHSTILCCSTPQLKGLTSPLRRDCTSSLLLTALQCFCGTTHCFARRHHCQTAPLPRSTLVSKLHCPITRARQRTLCYETASLLRMCC